MKNDEAERVRKALLVLLTHLFDCKNPELVVHMTEVEALRCEWRAGTLSGVFTIRTLKNRELNAKEVGALLSLVGKMNEGAEELHT